MIYMGLFVLLFVGIFVSTATRPDFLPQPIDLIQLEHKIENGEIEQINIHLDHVEALGRDGRKYDAGYPSETTRRELIELARGKGTNGEPRVAKIDENSATPPASPFAPLIGGGFVVWFAVHLFTILLMIGLMPFYVILAVKNERLDQTMRIVWLVLLCTLGLLANPIYWYLYIWRNPSVATSL
jgi:hypothetical protein